MDMNPLLDILTDTPVPIASPHLSVLTFQVCPIASCLLFEFLKRLDQTVSEVAKQLVLVRQHASNSMREGFRDEEPVQDPPTEYFNLVIKFLRAHTDGRGVVSLAAWTHRISVVVLPSNPSPSVVWMDGNTAFFLYENDKYSTAVDKLRRALNTPDKWGPRDSSGYPTTLEESLGGVNPLQEYYAPGMLSAINDWTREGVGLYSVADAYRVVTDHLGEDLTHNARFFILPGVEIHSQTMFFKKKLQAAMQPRRDDVGAGTIAGRGGIPLVNVNDFLDHVVSRMHAKETSLFVVADQPTYAMRNFFLKPEVFSGTPITTNPLEDGNASGMTIPGGASLITSLPIMQIIYGHAYRDVLLDGLPPGERRKALQQTLENYESGLTRSFTTSEFLSAGIGSDVTRIVGGSGEALEGAGALKENPFVSVVSGVSEFVQTYSSFYRKILKDRCGLLIDARRIGSFPIYPLLDDVRRFVNLLAELPKAALSVDNFLSPAGVQLISVLTSSFGMSSIPKNPKQSFFANMKTKDFDTRTLFALSHQLATSLRNSKAYIAKVFNFNAEIRRSRDVLNFINYFTSFSENLNAEATQMSQCLLSQEARSDNVAAQALYFWLKYWHDIFFINLRMVVFYSTPVVEGAFHAVARLFADSGLVQAYHLGGAKKHLLESSDMSAEMFSVWHEGFLCGESRAFLSQHLTENQQFMPSVDVMMNEQKTFMATIVSRLFARGRGDKDDVLRNLSDLDTFFQSFLAKVLKDATFQELADRRFPASLYGMKLPAQTVAKDANSYEDSLKDMAPFLFPNLQPIMRKYRAMALRFFAKGTGEDSGSPSSIWEDLMSTEMQKFQSLVSAMLYLNTLPHSSKLIQSAYALAQSGKSTEDSLFYQQKMRVLTTTYINALMNAKTLLAPLPKENSFPDLQDLLLQMRLLSNHATVIYDHLVKRHREFKADPPVHVMENERDMQYGGAATEEGGMLRPSRMSLLYTYVKYLYDAFSASYCTYKRMSYDRQ